MKNYSLQKVLSFLLCIVLIAAMALGTIGCSDTTANDTTATVGTMENGKVYGEGSTEFTFTVVDTEGKEVQATIRTDKTTVGEALLDLGLIAGEDGEYGLYVKTVNGTTLDYDKDGKYWAFYIDGEYAMTGVDSTEITAGSVYSFKAE
ncbi:MAG: DUF4430 domain-containing protein [Faecousia sp.]